MKNYIRSALDTLEALDFRLDHEDRKIRTDRWIFTHANSPDECLRINIHMKEQAARTVVQQAKQIVGLASVGAEKPAPKANQRAKAERAAETQRREAARATAEAKAAEKVAVREANIIASRRRELDRLMRGSVDTSGVSRFPAATGEARSDAALIPSTAMLTVDQVADHTGLADKVVMRAIESGRLEAYRCGKDVKVKGSDVRSWLGAA